MKRIQLTLITLALVAAFPAHAQDGAPTIGPEVVFEVAEALSLSEQQLDAVGALVDRANRTGIKIRVEIDLLKLDLRREMRKRKPDEARRSMLVDAASAKGAELGRVRLLTWVHIRELLSVEQRRLLTAEMRKLLLLRRVSSVRTPKAERPKPRAAHPIRVPGGAHGVHARSEPSSAGSGEMSLEAQSMRGPSLDWELGVAVLGVAAWTLPGPQQVRTFWPPLEPRNELGSSVGLRFTKLFGEEHDLGAQVYTDLVHVPYRGDIDALLNVGFAGLWHFPLGSQVQLTPVAGLHLTLHDSYRAGAKFALALDLLTPSKRHMVSFSAGMSLFGGHVSSDPGQQVDIATAGTFGLSYTIRLSGEGARPELARHRSQERHVAQR